MTLESNKVVELFVSHTDLAFNKEDNVVTGDNGGYYNKANMFGFEVEEEVEDGCDIGDEPFGKKGGEVSNYKVDRDFVDEDYIMRDDDDLFDYFVNEAYDRDVGGASNNQEKGCHMLPDCDADNDVSNAPLIGKDKGKSIVEDNVEDNIVDFKGEAPIYSVDKHEFNDSNGNDDMRG